MWGNPRLVQWDYGKEITVTLEDALMSLESLRFMMGGAIKKATASEPIYVHHTEEVVVDSDGNVPKPKDHLTGVELTPIATPGHPIRFINLTQGVRTQINAGTGEEKAMGTATAITFKNPALYGDTGTLHAAQPEDRIRIFWEEKVESSDAGKETAVEVVISPNTFPGTLAA